MKLEKCIEKFLNHCQVEKNLSDKSIKAYKIDLNAFEKFMKKDKICDIDKNDIKDYLNYLYNNSYKVKTIKRKIVSVKALFNFAEFEDIILQNPFRKVKINLKEEKKLPKVLTLTQVKKIFECLKNSEKVDKLYKRNLLIIELLLLSGMRVFELCNIKVEMIDFDDRLILIDGKGRKQRKIYISNDATLQLLKDVVKIFEIKKGYVFLNRSNKPITDQTVRNVVKNICKECIGLDNITPHIFRHTFATVLINDGVDIRHIQFLLGHSSITTTQIYTQMDDSVCKKIVMQNPINEMLSKTIS